MKNVKPMELHLAQGSYRKDRHGEVGEHVKVDEPIPNPPEHLDREAVREWVRIVGLMDKYKMIRATDMVCLTTYCMLYSEMQRMRENFPAARIAQLRAAYNDLGLSPTARSRIRVPDQSKNKGSDFDDL